MRSGCPAVAATTKVTIRLSPEARLGYERAELSGGVSLTALFEATGLELFDNAPRITEGLLIVLERARAIDLERRTRR